MSSASVVSQHMNVAYIVRENITWVTPFQKVYWHFEGSPKTMKLKKDVPKAKTACQNVLYYELSFFEWFNEKIMIIKNAQ